MVNRKWKTNSKQELTSELSVPGFSCLLKEGWPSHKDNDEREREKKQVKRQAAGLVMRVMSEHRSEHYRRKQARAVASETWYQEKRHRSKFGNPNYDAKPVGITPPMEITHPKDVARHLQPT